MHRYEEIVGQKLYVVQGGSIVAELYLRTAPLSVCNPPWTGVSLSGHRLCRLVPPDGGDPESCDFHDPSKSLWFPPVEES